MADYPVHLFIIVLYIYIYIPHYALIVPHLLIVKPLFCPMISYEPTTMFELYHYIIMC